MFVSYQRCVPGPWPIAPWLELLAAGLLFWIAATTAATAATVDPFFAQVPIGDTGGQARAVAYRDALARVLIKLSGDPATVAALAEGPGLGPADPLVRQHRYLEAERVPDQLEPETLLEVRFNPTRIRDRARELGLPVWPLERPPTLIWIALEREDRSRSLLGTAEEDEPALAAIERTAAERALPIVLPLMDLEDQLAIRVPDVWAGYADRLAAAAARYAAPLLLLGRGYRSGGGWTIQWFLSGESIEARLASEGPTLDQALSNAVEGLADHLGRRFAIMPSDEAERIVIRVFGIDDVVRYGAVFGHLKSLSVVSRAEPFVIAPDHMDFALISDAGVGGVSRALEFGRVLRRLDEFPIGDAAVDLSYQVVP